MSSPTEKKNDILSILSRFKQVVGVETDTELAIYLGLSPSTPAAWKRRRSVDYELLLSKLTSGQAMYVLYGRGGEGLDELNKAGAKDQTPSETRPGGVSRGNSIGECEGEDMIQCFHRVVREFGIDIRWENLSDDDRKQIRQMFMLLSAERKKAEADTAAQLVRYLLQRVVSK